MCSCVSLHKSPEHSYWGKAGRSINGERFLDGAALLCVCQPVPAVLKGHCRLGKMRG